MEIILTTETTTVLLSKTPTAGLPKSVIISSVPHMVLDHDGTREGRKYAFENELYRQQGWKITAKA